MAEVREITCDVVVLGGGVAGLWILDALRRSGTRALLVETGALGSGQTITAQGILHGGVKYALSGAPSDAARAVRDMPDRWRRSLTGVEEPDLTSVHLRAPVCHLWGADTLRGMAGLLGARAFLRASPEKVADAERPASLARVPGAVLRVPEPVLCPRSLLEVLAERNAPFLLAARAVSPRRVEGGGSEVLLGDPRGGADLLVRARMLVLSAGAGNESLRAGLGLPPGAMQRRALHVPLLRGEMPTLNGHCVEGASVRLTVTTGRDRSGRVVWHLGGGLSEEGVRLEPPALLRLARAEVERLLPGTDLSGAQGATFRVDRAEGRGEGGSMPGDVTVLRDGDVVTAWPTKLVLAPRLAERVLDLLQLAACSGREEAWRAEATSLAWPSSPVAPLPWDREDLTWTGP
ncbi:MAG: FAD-dependent oxidoreductase [Planctomycetes bacterium]|nr:FAD-dependent oxidoreductase [Planctomycetota bacterium]